MPRIGRIVIPAPKTEMMRLRIGGLINASRESSETTQTAASVRQRVQNLVEHFRRHLPRIENRARIVDDDVANRIKVALVVLAKPIQSPHGSWRGQRPHPLRPRCRNDGNALRSSTDRFRPGSGCRKQVPAAGHTGREPARTESPGVALRSGALFATDPWQIPAKSGLHLGRETS